MPLSAWSPRSTNAIPEPATRSFTVEVDEDFSRTRDGGDPRADVHGDPAQLVADLLAFACVEARTDVEVLARAALGGTRENPRRHAHALGVGERPRVVR